MFSFSDKCLVLISHTTPLYGDSTTQVVDFRLRRIGCQTVYNTINAKKKKIRYLFYIILLVYFYNLHSTRSIVFVFI